MLLIDTNLLVLLVVGFASPSFIEGHRRTRAYTLDDFRLLRDLVAREEIVRTTPHVLAETSNLARQFAEPGRARISAVLAGLIGSSIEVHLPAQQVVQDPDFTKLGLTDAAVLLAQDGETTLLTDDLDLYVASVTRGLKAVNFSHLRDAD